MRKFIFLITVIAAACMLFIPSAYSQSDSDLVWIRENQKVGNATSIYLSPDGQTFLVSKYFEDVPGSDKIYIYSVETGDLVDSIMNQGNIGGFSPDKRYIYTYLKETKNSVVRKIDAETHQLARSSTVFDASWHSGFGVLSDGRLIVSVQQGKNLYYILDGNDLVVLDSMPIQPPYSNGALNMCVYTEGNIAAFSQFGEDKTDPNRTRYFRDFSLYNITEKKYIKSLPESLTQGLSSWKYFPDGNRIAIDNSGILRIINWITLDSTILTYDANRDLYFSSNNIFYYGTHKKGISAVNQDNYAIYCSSSLYQDNIASRFIITKDEKYIIAADSRNGVIMKVRNCYFNTGINEKGKEIIHIIYPNPGSDTYTISNNYIPDKTYLTQVINADGLQIMKIPITFIYGKGNFTVGKLAVGTYFLRLSTSDKVYIYKFVVGS